MYLIHSVCVLVGFVSFLNRLEGKVKDCATGGAVSVEGPFGKRKVCTWKYTELALTHSHSQLVRFGRSG